MKIYIWNEGNITNIGLSIDYIFSLDSALEFQTNDPDPILDRIFSEKISFDHFKGFYLAVRISEGLQWA